METVWCEVDGGDDVDWCDLMNCSAPDSDLRHNDVNFVVLGEIADTATERVDDVHPGVFSKQWSAQEVRRCLDRDMSYCMPAFSNPQNQKGLNSSRLFLFFLAESMAPIPNA